MTLASPVYCDATRLLSVILPEIALPSHFIAVSPLDKISLLVISTFPLTTFTPVVSDLMESPAVGVPSLVPFATIVLLSNTKFLEADATPIVKLPLVTILLSFTVSSVPNNSIPYTELAVPEILLSS